MAERRALIEGLKSSPSVDPAKEDAFVYGATKAVPAPEPKAVATASDTPSARRGEARVQLSTKMRANLADALKRASLERELNGQEPYKLQDILEQAIEPWLRTNGYLK